MMKVFRVLLCFLLVGLFTACEDDYELAPQYTRVPAIYSSVELRLYDEDGEEIPTTSNRYKDISVVDYNEPGAVHQIFIPWNESHFSFAFPAPKRHINHHLKQGDWFFSHCLVKGPKNGIILKGGFLYDPQAVFPPDKMLWGAGQMGSANLLKLMTKDTLIAERKSEKEPDLVLPLQISKEGVIRLTKTALHPQN